MKDIKDAIRQTQLVIPDDFVVPDVNYIRKQVEGFPGKEPIDEKVYALARFVYKERGIKGTIPPGFNEALSYSIAITSAACLATALPGREPTIKCVSDLIGKDRNFVAAFAKGLSNGHLVDLHSQKREELIRPTTSGLAFNDLAIMNGAWTYRALEKVAKHLQSDARDKAIEELEDLEMGFHMAEKAYDSSTLNFKIMQELHQRSTESVVNARNGKIDAALERIAILVDDLKTMAATKRKARKMGLRSMILEETGEELGRARVYKVK